MTHAHVALFWAFCAAAGMILAVFYRELHAVMGLI